MNIIKIKYSSEIPKDYTGLVEWGDGDKAWYKNRKIHKEDGPAYIGRTGYKSWYLDGKHISDSIENLDLTNETILSKSQHPEYPTVQVWKILDTDKVYEQIIIPGMEEYIQE